jgi:rubrerythrin
MLSKKLVLTALLFSCLAVVLLPLCAHAAIEAPALVVGTTLENLMAAFNGESNANARYLAFAEKADAEGYAKAAVLFRAAARAEQIHFERHAAAIKALGGEAVATIETPVVGTTAENLQAAMDGEIYENTVMYPAFLAIAEADGDVEATDAFEDAEKAEGVHASLYKQSLDDLNNWKTAANFMVCPKCGNVVESIPGPECPICGEDTTKFITIS